MIHANWYWCPNLTIDRCEYVVLHLATADRLVSTEMTIPAMYSDYVKLQTPCLSDTQYGANKSTDLHSLIADRQYQCVTDHSSCSQPAWIIPTSTFYTTHCICQYIVIANTPWHSSRKPGSQHSADWNNIPLLALTLCNLSISGNT